MAHKGKKVAPKYRPMPTTEEVPPTDQEAAQEERLTALEERLTSIQEKMESPESPVTGGKVDQETGDTTEYSSERNIVEEPLPEEEPIV